MQTFSQYGPVLDVRGISADLDRFYGQVALFLSLVLDSDYSIFRYIIWCSLALRSAGSLRLCNIRSLARSPRPLLAIRIGFSYARCLIALVLTSRAIFDERSWGIILGESATIFSVPMDLGLSAIWIDLDCVDRP